MGSRSPLKTFLPSQGIWGSRWIGFEHFKTFFEQYNFREIISNTVLLSFWNLIIAFPTPIIMALLLNQLRQEKLKRFIQTTIYAPYFISTVVLVGMLHVFFAPDGGMVNNIIQLFGGKPILFMQQSALVSSVVCVLDGLARNRFRIGYLFGGVGRHRPASARGRHR